MAKKSILTRFNIALGVMYVGSVVACLPIVYSLTKQQVYQQANRELTLLVDSIQAIHHYVGNDLRPYFMENKLFYVPGMSGFAATERVFKKFRELQPAYYVKNVSDNPLNPKNKPEPYEKELLDYFRDHRDREVIIDQGSINGNTYLVSAAAKVSKPGCLSCHSSPDKAPPELTRAYGTDSGYNYRNNEVVGLTVIGVPLENVKAVVMKRALIIVGVLTVIFAILFIIANLMVRRLVIMPVLDITAAAKAVSEGDLQREISIKREDEIGDLAMSFELMRRSMVKALNRLRGNR